MFAVGHTSQLKVGIQYVLTVSSRADPVINIKLEDVLGARAHPERYVLCDAPSPLTVAFDPIPRLTVVRALVGRLSFGANVFTVISSRRGQLIRPYERLDRLLRFHLIVSFYPSFDAFSSAKVPSVSAGHSPFVRLEESHLRFNR